MDLYASLARSKATGDRRAYQDAVKSSARELLAAGRHDAAKLILEAGLEAPALDASMYRLYIRCCTDTAPAKSFEALRAANELAQRAALAQEPEALLQGRLATAIAHMLAARDPASGEGPEAREAHESAALALLQQLAAQQPGHEGVAYHLALLLASLGRHDAAVAATKAALAAAGAGRGEAMQPCLALLALLLSVRCAGVPPPPAGGSRRSCRPRRRPPGGIGRALLPLPRVLCRRLAAICCTMQGG
jgi:hypothetical protein